MDAVGAIRTAIAQYGQPVSLTKDGVTYRFTACVMPRSYGASGAADKEHSRFGTLDTRRFSYYGPLTGGGELVSEDTCFTAGGMHYRVIASHDFYCRAQPAFRHCVAQREGCGETGK